MSVLPFVNCEFKELLGLLLPTPPVRRIHFFQHLTGIEAVVLYNPRIFKVAGIASRNEVLAATIGVGVTKTAFILTAILLVDRVGRRPLYLSSLAGFIASLACLRFGLTIVERSAPHPNLLGRTPSTCSATTINQQFNTARRGSEQSIERFEARRAHRGHEHIDESDGAHEDKTRVPGPLDGADHKCRRRARATASARPRGGRRGVHLNGELVKFVMKSGRVMVGRGSSSAHREVRDFRFRPPLPPSPPELAADWNSGWGLGEMSSSEQLRERRTDSAGTGCAAESLAVRKAFRSETAGGRTTTGRAGLF